MSTRGAVKKEPFFSKDKNFYQIFRQMILLTVLNNLITYSVNMLDNVMLGMYSQTALSAASAVNQIFFLVQQLAMSLGNSLVILASQYWGKNEVDPIRTLTGYLTRFALLCGLAVTAVCICISHPLLSLFTPTEEIIEEGAAYLSIIQWTFPLFMVSTIFSSALRSVDSARTGFITAVISLATNAVLNSLLIFGRLGFPELGIRGAAIATLVSRILELSYYIFYLVRKDPKMHLFSKFRGTGGFLGKDKVLRKSLVKVSLPVTAGTMIWSVSVPLQTAILGHLSDDAIAANAAASTFYQYLKVVVTALSNVSSALVGNAIGSAKASTPPGQPTDYSNVRAVGRTLSVIDVLVGLLLGLILFVLRKPLLSMYQLTDSAALLADHMIVILSVVMVGMSYQMPVNGGILQGGGDIRFATVNNLISVWLIVMPLSFLAAFVWKWPVEWVVIILQSDQLFKCLPVFLRFHGYKWIKELT